jgi:hypothetical protein
MATITPKNEPIVVADQTTDGSGLHIQPVSAEAAGKYAEDLAFLEEEVEVMLQAQTGDGDTTRLVGPIAVNGVGIYVPRGEWVKMKRKFLGVLLTARTESWTFTAAPTPNGGAKHREYAVRNARFPIAGVRDNNPRGAGWLQHLQSNPY